MWSACQDVRFGLRLLRKNPGFALSCILTLVLGVLLNTAAFGVMNALLFGKLPFRDSDRIVVVRTANRGLGMAGVAWADYQAASAEVPAFSATAAFRGRTYNLSVPVPGARPAQVRGGMMSASTLQTLGYRPLLGRGFEQADEGSYSEAAGPPVVLIAEGLWRRQFGAEPGVIGRRLTLDGTSATIIGVLPFTFRFVYGGYQVVAPLPREIVQPRQAERDLEMLARLRPGIGVTLANRQLEAVSARLSEPHPPAGVLYSSPYRETVFREASRMYPVLLAGALLLLLLVCANLSNLMLARTAVRGREIAIRLAVGAPRARIVRQVITEGALLGAIGAVLSLTGAVWLRHLIVARVPELSVFAVDSRVVLYTLAVGLLAGLVFALTPALESTHPRLSGALKSGGITDSPGGHRLRGSMIAAQVAVSIMLLTGTGLLIGSVANLRHIDKSVDLDGVVATTLQLRGGRYAEAGQRLRFWEELAGSVSAALGVEAAGVTGALPLTTMPEPESVELEAQAARPGGEPVRMVRSVADRRYMAAVSWNLVAGRGFTAADRAGSPAVAIVNEALARRFWPDSPQQAVGRRIRVGPGGHWSTIVGVARNARQFLLFPPAAEVIAPVAQAPERASTLVVRAPGLHSEAVRELVLRELCRLDPDLPAGDFLSQGDIIEMFYPKVMIGGLGILAAAAIGLASVGLYGVVSFVVSRRTREIAVRIALGAGGSAVLALVLREGLRSVLAGVVLGMGGALAVTVALRSLLFEVSAIHAGAFLVAPAVVIGVALLALLVPAVRASRIQPAAALQSE